ncbi:glycosyltransferase family 4 protein [Roseivirga pacifica]|uniref:glycosyltransferase family 4 protein n=1 Tax=Roseivirga pacifica TaxID=1267423 RepID=UPI003BA8F92F
MTEGEKVLVVTYYWPPSGGAGVQRWLKFTKYLPEFGYDPIVFTPENPSFDLVDESLLKDVSPKVDVLKFPIWEPYQLFKKLTGTKEVKQGQILEEGKKSLVKRASIWLRGNLFVPDPRVFWVKPSVDYLAGIIESNGIKKIITTGPPHSVHLIGMKLKMKQPSLAWLADFRDPWTEWDIMRQFNIMPFRWKKHQKLEQQVLKVADAVLATGKTAAEDFKRLGARRVYAITNGYDEEDVSTLKAEKLDKFTLAHVGMVNEKRNPVNLFESLEELLVADELSDDVELQLTGILSPAVLQTLEQYPRLKKIVKLKDSIPHKEVHQVYATASLLLLFQTDTQEAHSQLPGKLFEYLAAKRPVLALGATDSDVAEILDKTSAGKMLAYQDKAAIKSFVLYEYKNWKSETPRWQFKDIEKFSRRELTKSLVDILNAH